MRVCLALLLLLTLTACGGWQLRGAGGTGLEGRAVAVVGADPYPALAQALDRQLQPSNARRVDPAAAELVIAIVREQQNRRTLSVGADARVQEYELNYIIEYSLRTAEGELLLPTERVAAARAYRFDPQNVLGSESTERNLLRELRAETVRRLLMRAAAQSRAEGQ